MNDNSKHNTQNHREPSLESASPGIDHGMLKFFTVAVLIFALFTAVYEYYLLDAPVFFKYLELAAKSAHWLLERVSDLPLELKPVGLEKHLTQISLDGAGNTFVIVTSGCDASIVFAVLIATVSAWPANPIAKCLALVLGLFIMYALNIVRIAGMMLVEVHAQSHFELFHEWILPTLLVIGPMLYFYAWTIVSGRHPSDSAH